MIFDFALTLGRWLQFSAAAVLFGAPLFSLYGFATPGARRHQWIVRLVGAAAIAALAAGFLSLLAQAGEMSGDAGDSFRPSVVWTVVAETHFGSIWFVRLVLIGVAIAISSTVGADWDSMMTRTAIGAAVLSSLALTGHGSEGEGIGSALHLVADVAHLLAAGVWIGALAPLAILLWRTRSGEADDARAALFGLKRFSAVGVIVVAVLIVTGLVNSWFLVGLDHVAAALNTGYGQALALKLALFALMLALAAFNRSRTHQLERVHGEAGRTGPILQRVRQSVLTETTLAIFVLGAVAWLGTLEPPISMQ